ncbi:hypothetical protein [Parahaliea aestuarii]|uniref:hypothetical protein n=1 Tax=Parahaliea aestuarii TaxID=1852021 RepID=UPI001650053A|nr:hypothetical protein [Parahaliea aestuarii]
MLALQTANYEHPMDEQSGKHREGEAPRKDGATVISLVQRGNLKSLESTLRKQWRLGQNIVLCWSADERGLLVLFVPHYFLGNYCAHPGDDGSDNEHFVRELISGSRRKSREDLFAIAARLDVAPSFIKLETALAEEPAVQGAVEQLIKRYGISYVDCRGVLLFDIAEFSLFTPFEQASQLNSLSYSMNSAYNKLQGKGVDINFARTTTGDGYYVWNRDNSPTANQDLFTFLLLVVADNAVARAASRGNTVPVIRCAYHAGSHYELYQAEGVNPTVFSYIVGDVTIDLARMVDLARPHQVLVGNFSAQVRRDDGSVESMRAPAFVKHCSRALGTVEGIQLSGKSIVSMRCGLTGENEVGERRAARRFRVIDKHGLSRTAYNLELDIEFADGALKLGLEGANLDFDEEADDMAPDARQQPAASIDKSIEDLASLLRNLPRDRGPKE